MRCRIAWRFGRQCTGTRGGAAGLDILAADDGVGEDGFVGVFELRPGGQASGEAGDADGAALELGGDVKGGAVAFDGRVEAEDDFRDGGRAGFGLLDAGEEGVDGELGGANAFEWAEAAHEDVVEASEHASLLECDDVFGLFDDEDGGAFAGGVFADVAAAAVGEVPAGGAVADGFLDLADGVGEGEDVFGGALEDVEGEAFGGAAADAGEFDELSDEAFDGAGVGGDSAEVGAGLGAGIGHARAYAGVADGGWAGRTGFSRGGGDLGGKRENSGLRV